jgi:hypothetical protein
MGATQRIGLHEYLTVLRQRGWTIMVTNLIQGKLEVEEKEIMNAQSYFPHIFGSTVDCRLRIDEHSVAGSTFTVHTLKNLNSKHYQFITEMGAEGLAELIVQKFI